MAKPVLIGVDGGTESLRAGVFDTAGRLLGSAASAYETRFPRAGWAEQDPLDWWRAIGEATRGAIGEAGVAPTDVAAMAVDTTCCSVVALDGDAMPLRPALIWMDVRSGEEAALVAATADPALKVNGAGSGPVSAEWMIPKALWLARHEPEVFARAATICEFQDFLNAHLTGRMAASVNTASVRWHYDGRAGGYAAGLVRALAIPELLAKWPAELVPPGGILAGLTPRAAEHLGLPSGLPVAQGGSDAFIGMIGLGVVRPGRLAFITGSSHLHLGLSAQPLHGRGIWGTYPDAVVPGLHVVEGGQTSTGSVVRWFRDLVGGSYDGLATAAAALPPGSEGLVVLEHFQGNRTPYTDPDSRGVIAGLTLRHGPAHIFRAIMEGIAFGSELILETMRGHGFAPRDVVVAGGATRSDLWLQIHADVSGLPLSLTRTADAPMLGSAILAAVGAGLFPDIPTAADAMVEVVRTIEPDAARHRAYAPFYQAYKDTYPAIAPILHRQSAAARRAV